MKKAINGGVWKNRFNAAARYITLKNGRVWLVEKQEDVQKVYRMLVRQGKI